MTFTNRGGGRSSPTILNRARVADRVKPLSAKFSSPKTLRKNDPRAPAKEFWGARGGKKLRRLRWFFPPPPGFLGIEPVSSIKKQCLCCERRPYTHPSGFTSPRSFSSLLRTGNLAAHTVYRLMLLDPSPDMVHGSALRKTRSSTQEKELNSEKIHSQEGNPPLL